MSEYVRRCVAARELEHVRLVLLWLIKLIREQRLETDWAAAYASIAGAAREEAKRVYNQANLSLPQL